MGNRVAQAKKIAGWCVPAMAFLIPSGFYSLVLPILILMAVCRIIGGDLRLQRSKWKEPVIFFSILFYLYLFIEFFFSHNFGQALSSLSEKLPFLLFPLIIGTSADIDREWVDRSLTIFVASLCLWLTAAFLYAAWDTIRTHQDTIQLGDGFYNKFSWYGLTRVFDNWHPTYVSVFCNLAIAILFSRPAPSQARSRFYRVASPLAFLLFSVSIFLLNSITGIIIYCCLMLFFGYKWLRRFRLSRMVRIGCVLLTLGLLAGLVYTNPMKLEKIDKLRQKGWHATDQDGQTNVLTIRLAKWTAHMGVLHKNYLFGATPGDIKDLREQAYEEKGYKDLALHNYNAHNEYLEVLATYGIAGFLIFLFILLAALFQPAGHPLLLPFMIAALIAFTTESMLERQQGLLFFFFFYSLLTLQWPISDPVRRNLLNFTANNSIKK